MIVSLYELWCPCHNAAKGEGIPTGRDRISRLCEQIYGLLHIVHALLEVAIPRKGFMALTKAFHGGVKRKETPNEPVLEPVEYCRNGRSSGE